MKHSVDGHECVRYMIQVFLDSRRILGEESMYIVMQFLCVSSWKASKVSFELNIWRYMQNSMAQVEGVKRNYQGIPKDSDLCVNAFYSIQLCRRGRRKYLYVCYHTEGHVPVDWYQG
ncbi:hypothetical protein KP509_04G001900 [Ceratopteris richardii]|nr:hypothetical protein KP509_04G001900 [Ceratopteris richardii]